MNENILELKERNKQISKIVDAYNMTKLSFEIQRLLDEVISRSKVREIVEKVKQNFNDYLVNKEFDSFFGKLLNKEPIQKTNANQESYKEDNGISFVKKDGHFNSLPNKDES